MVRGKPEQLSFYLFVLGLEFFECQVTLIILFVISLTLYFVVH